MLGHKGSTGKCIYTHTNRHAHMYSIALTSLEPIDIYLTAAKIQAVIATIYFISFQSNFILFNYGESLYSVYHCTVTSQQLHALHYILTYLYCILCTSVDSCHDFGAICYWFMWRRRRDWDVGPKRKESGVFSQFHPSCLTTLCCHTFLFSKFINMHHLHFSFFFFAESHSSVEYPLDEDRDDLTCSPVRYQKSQRSLFHLY